MFRVGQKVIFIGGKHELEPPGHESALKIGAVYTIREIDPLYIKDYGVTGIRVEELVCPLERWSGGVIEPAVLAHKFRPIVSRKTSIEIFQRMLTPKQKELAR